MKIDYELVDRIGATHYDNEGRYLKYGRDGYFNEYLTQQGEWVNPGITPMGAVHYQIKPIPPKPQMHVEYEEVNCKSFFDLYEWFNLGELYFDANGDVTKKSKILTELHLSQLFFRNAEMYRRIEKPVDWQSAVAEFMKGYPTVGRQMNQELIDGLNDGCWDDMTDNDFLEMCRVALRANGEL